MKPWGYILLGALAILIPAGIYGYWSFQEQWAQTFELNTQAALAHGSDRKSVV